MGRIQGFSGFQFCKEVFDLISLPTFLEIPHENGIIYTKGGFEQAPRTPSGSASED